jgi:transcription initiation factor IIE alpha subunit
MPEVELELNCDNCGSKCLIRYDTDQVHYDPESCPFCGEVVGLLDDESMEEEADEELDLWGDDGLSNSDDTNWN